MISLWGIGLATLQRASVTEFLIFYDGKFKIEIFRNGIAEMLYNPHILCENGFPCRRMCWYNNKLNMKCTWSRVKESLSLHDCLAKFASVICTSGLSVSLFFYSKCPKGKILFKDSERRTFILSNHGMSAVK